MIDTSTFFVILDIGGITINNKTYHLYTDEEKLKIVKDHINNRIPIRACATKYNISITSLVYWLRKYRENGVDGLKEVLAIIKKEGTQEPTVLHTDQGSVYASISYKELIKDYNIKRSMSRAGTPTDNPVDESLNGWIKEELFLDFDLANSNDVEALIAKYVKYYNNERPAYSLKYKTPAQFISELGF